jgi:hypothetical protein
MNVNYIIFDRQGMNSLAMVIAFGDISFLSANGCTAIFAILPLIFASPTQSDLASMSPCPEDWRWFGFPVLVSRRFRLNAAVCSPAMSH